MVKLSPTLRILDLDGSVTRQKRLAAAAGGRIDRIDLLDLGPVTRYFSPRRAMSSIASRLKPDDRDRLTLMGSGDYHHVTAALLRQFHEPLSVVVFDTHPDWDRSSPWPCCGSWVLEALRMPNIKKIVMIGLGRCDLDRWRVNWGKVPHLLSGRVAFYPYDCERSWSFGAARADLHCATVRPRAGHSEIRWNRVVASDWRDLLREVVDGLPTDDVYLSIDKDCLKRDAAVSNWEEGGLSLDQLLAGVRALSAAKTIVGADITGEYSAVTIHNRLFRALAAWERPKLVPPTERDLLLNESTNMAILSTLGLIPDDRASGSHA